MLPSTETVDLAGSEYAVKLLFKNGDAAVYALDSIAAATRGPMQEALGAVVLHRARFTRAGGLRERLAGADDLAPDRHALEVAVGDDGVA